jgi:pimeloyl-ACP methyl ester carboxylesterase
MVSLSIPFLGLLGTVDEPMGWGVNERDVRPWLPRHGRLHVFEDIGHFLHIEQPREVADIVLEFIA